MLIINYLHRYVGLILNAPNQLPLRWELVALLYSNDMTSYPQQPILRREAPTLDGVAPIYHLAHFY